jgi:hypothetical protein
LPGWHGGQAGNNVYVARAPPTAACHLAPVPRLKIGLAPRRELDILIVAGSIILPAGYASHRAVEAATSWLPRHLRSRSRPLKQAQRLSKLHYAAGGLTVTDTAVTLVRVEKRYLMQMSTSAFFSFALAAFTLALPGTSALAFEGPALTAAATSNVVKVRGESRQERAERRARQHHERCMQVRDECHERYGERRQYYRCSETRGCGGTPKEPASMTLLFPAG